MFNLNQVRKLLNSFVCSKYNKVYLSRIRICFIKTGSADPDRHPSQNSRSSVHVSTKLSFIMILAQINLFYTVALKVKDDTLCFISLIQTSY